MDKFQKPKADKKFSRSAPRPDKRQDKRSDRRQDKEQDKSQYRDKDQHKERRPYGEEPSPKRARAYRSDKEAFKPNFRDGDSARDDARDDDDSLDNTTKVTARMLSYRALVKVFEHGFFVDVALESQKAYALLTPQDRAFARWLTAGVVRYHKRLDRVISQFWQKAPPFNIRLILEMGAMQLLLSETPEHAAVSETVSLCTRRDESFRGLVNGVLRNIIRENKIDITTLDPVIETPKWMMIAWENYFGRSLAKDIAIANLKEADIDISFKDENHNLLDLPKARPLPGGGARLREHKGRVNRIKGFKNGAFWVQDAAAQLPVKLLGDISGKKILDLCAAPGGKTLQMLAQGADVTAVDLSVARMKRLEDNLERMGFSASPVVADILSWETSEQFDIVLLDAPCSATGTIRRHPEILRHRSEEEVEGLSELQAQLLEKAQKWVKPEGLLIYVTCSLQPQEGIEQVKAFLANNPSWQALDLSEQSQKLKIEKAYHPETAHIQTHSALWEKIGGMDGFFITILKQKV